MKRGLSILLLLAAMLGLLGRGAAFAQVIPVAKAEHIAAAAQMSPECAEMMGLAAQKPTPGKPCDGMTPDCVAKMGCAVAVALVPPLASTESQTFRAAVPRLAATTPLVGRDIGPEPEPPASLG